MRFFIQVFTFLLISATFSKAQLTYTFDNNVKVMQNGVELSQPLAGGFVAPQFSAIDLDLDGTNDLFVFDRASSKVFTYLFKDGEYEYAPYYESLFPTNLTNWVLLSDYNCDGKMDLFTSSIFGMSLYENTSTDNIQWKLIYQTIFTEGSNGQTNLQISGLDLPAIVDVDNDGDLDILNFNFATGGGIEFHQNLSMENTGVCGMDLKRMTRKYGDFEECTCDSYAFDGNDCSTGGRLTHSGGKSILSFSYSSTLVQDLIIGQEFCTLPGYLPNTGTLDTAKMESVSFDFPDANNPLRMEYPAFYELDLFEDGEMDLLVSPNTYIGNGQQNYSESLYQYTKNGLGEYEFITNQFLKNQMIDVGHQASPVFVDIDFDGDEDLLIGSGKKMEGASLYLYENIGSPSLPSFVLKTTNYLDLVQEGYERIKTQMFDVNNNGFSDLILTIVLEDAVKSFVFLHTGNPEIPYDKTKALELKLPDMGIWDSPYFYSLGSETALFIGKQAGNLAYYSTQGTMVEGNWQLITNTYLGIEEDFAHRNLSLHITDINANNSADLITIDDSGEVMVYDDFRTNSTPEKLQAFDVKNNDKFDFNFGKIAHITAAKLSNKVEPTLVIGLLTGGVQILTNTQETENNTPFALKIIGYPNPIENGRVVVQSNKNGLARVIDAMGKEVLGGFEVEVGAQNELLLNVMAGIYFLEVTAQSGEQQTLRLVMPN